MGAVLLEAVTRWECPNCTAVHVTTVAQPHIPFHECPGLHDLLAPYVPAGTDCKVEAVGREDYVNGETGLRYDAAGRPVTAVVTIRADGSNDTAVFPGVATGIQQEV